MSQCSSHFPAPTRCLLFVSPSELWATNRWLAEDVVQFVGRDLGYYMLEPCEIGLVPSALNRELDLLETADLVVFQLDRWCPNVLFRLGLRYRTGLPMICVNGPGVVIPGDIAHTVPLMLGLENDRSANREILRKRMCDILTQNDQGIIGRPYYEVRCKSPASLDHQDCSCRKKTRAGHGYGRHGRLG